MSFISYAQNFEDVMLWRALKHVQHGFYIDVGANDPTVDSVTKAFYDKGWRGINIEPLKSHYQDLLKARPNDINLLCAAGAEHGQIDIWECEVRGWATASGDVIQKHEKDGHSGVLHKVSLFPLKDICEQYVQGDIHFLKIDVEGFEKDVLEGMNFKKFRPWIVVVEATKPNSTEQIYEKWEALIISNNYVFAYADGLNRFYVSKEQELNLLNSLRYPPNVFDEFTWILHYDALMDAQKAKAKAQEAQEKIISLEALEVVHLQQIKMLTCEVEDMGHELKVVQQANHTHWQLAEQRQAQLNALLNSKSWRITAPFRWSLNQLQLLRAQGVKQRIKAAVKKVLRKVLPWVLARPIIKTLAINLANKLGLSVRLKPILVNLLQTASSLSKPSNHLGMERNHLVIYLDKRAARVFADLQNAVNRTNVQ